MTVEEVAAATGRGLCDIGRYNSMVDVSIPMNVGQTLAIPGEVCEPDSTTCVLTNTTATNVCVNGGPRLYYTVKGDTYEKIALRYNLQVGAVATNGANATAPLTVGQFVKIPLCSPSECVIKPYTFESGVYKDLAEEYGSTVGQLMGLSATYNYSEWRLSGNNAPTIDLAINCTATSDNVTVIS